MRLSQHFGRTLREAPADAQTIGHALMVRAGIARPVEPAVWSYLPLGWRVIRKIETLLRQAMDALGAQELRLPASLSSEASVVALALREVESYKDLPRAVYQQQSKPGVGPRSRETLTHDACSLHADVSDLNRFDQAVFQAYLSLFHHCDLDALPVESGGAARAFVLPHPGGDAQIVRCARCDYGATLDTAAFERGSDTRETPLPLEKVATPACKTIGDVCAFLKKTPEQTLKAVFYTADSGLDTERTFVIMLRGDLDVSETKLIQTIGVKTLTAAAEDEIRNRLGAEPGYASPLGLDPARHWVIGDESLTGLVNFVTGANEPGYHVVNANYPRDFAVTQIADVAFAPDGADCLRCGGRLSVKPAIQLGLCAQMGSVLSTPAGVTFLDPDGQRHPVFMGEYQIDLDQMLRAIVETHHDQHGIVWPAAVAPYDAHLVAIAKDETAAQAAETLYADLAAAGFDVLYDDRNLSPGVMFADADLMGMPVRLTVSPRSLSSGGVEVKQRRGGESVIAPIANLAAELPGFLTAG